MLTYDMQMRGDMSLYEYLYFCVRHDIESGAIAANEKLPSKRALAKHLGVSLITVEGAYTQLLAEGYIYAIQRKGYYACDAAFGMRNPGSGKAGISGAHIAGFEGASHETKEQMFHVKHLEDAHAENTRKERTHAENTRRERARAQDVHVEGVHVLDIRAEDIRAEAAYAEAAHVKDAYAGDTRAEVAHMKGAYAGERACACGSFSAPLLADFTGATAPRGLFPYKAWARVVRETLSCESEETLLASSGAMGSLRLRQALASYLRGQRGMDVSAVQIVVGAGSQTLYNLLVQLLGRDRTYAVEEPGYPRLTHIYRSNDVALVHVGLDEAGVSVESLRASGADVLHCMPSHQLPMGMVMPIARRRELLRWAGEAEEEVGAVESGREDGGHAGGRVEGESGSLGGKHAAEGDGSWGGFRVGKEKSNACVAIAGEECAYGRRYIIEDDYDCEFRMAGRPIPSLQSIDDNETVIYTNTFTNTLGPSFRIGYMVLPPHLAQRFRDDMGFYSCTVGAIDQVALARYIESGDYERHVSRLRTHYRRVQEALVGALQKLDMASHLRFRNVGAGLHFIMEVDVKTSAEDVAERARTLGVALAPLERYRLGDASPAEANASVRTSASAHEVADAGAGADADASAEAGMSASVGANANVSTSAHAAASAAHASASFVMNFASLSEEAIPAVADAIIKAVADEGAPGSCSFAFDTSANECFT